MESGAGPEARAEKVACLLDAALPEFATAGLSGARVDAIARAAGMNKRLLYHYVGDKAALFDATLNLAFDRILASPESLHGDEWRLICHGYAAGRTHRLAELESLTGASAGGGAEPFAATALGLRLLAGLMPDLADRLLGNERGDEAGRNQAVGRALRRLHNPAPKPRLKMRPQLRTGSSS